MVAVNVYDESPSGRRDSHLRLVVDADCVTVGELIAQRVRAEIERAEAEGTRRRFVGLVRPRAMEAAEPIDADEQIRVACDAFERGRVLLLVDDRQVEGLEELLELRDESEVSFIRLVPLVGG